MHHIQNHLKFLKIKKFEQEISRKYEFFILINKTFFKTNFSPKMISLVKIVNCCISKIIRVSITAVPTPNIFQVTLNIVK